MKEDFEHTEVSTDTDIDWLSSGSVLRRAAYIERERLKRDKVQEVELVWEDISSSESSESDDDKSDEEQARDFWWSFDPPPDAKTKGGGGRVLTVVYYHDDEAGCFRAGQWLRRVDEASHLIRILVPQGVVVSRRRRGGAQPVRTDLILSYIMLGNASTQKCSDQKTISISSSS